MRRGCRFSDAEIESLLVTKTGVLQRKLHRLLRNLSDHRVWTGAFGETTTGLPIIGPVPGMRHCWIALGYGGNGTTYAAIAADVIVGGITGRPDVDADLYPFQAHEKAL